MNSLHKSIICFFISLLLSACVNSPAPVLQSHIDRLIGYPISNAINVLGYPANEGKIMGNKFYVWQASGSVYRPDIYTTNGTGMFGSASFDYQQTSIGPGHNVAIGCQIRLMVDAKDIVRHWDYHGDARGCSIFAEKMDPKYFYCVSHLC